jgi:hypothetical protein
MRSIALVSTTLAMVLAAVPALAGARVTSVDVRPSTERVDVVVTASEPLTFQSWSRSSPPVLVVDLLDTTADEKTITPGGAIQKIAVTRHDARGAAMSRLSLELKNAVDYDVTARGNEITVSLFLTGKKDASTFSTTPAPAKVATLSPKSSTSSDAIVDGSIGRATSDVDLAQAGEGPRQMSYIGFKNTATQSRIYARLNAEAKFTVRKAGDNLVVLEIQNATIPLRNNKNHLDTQFFNSPVKMITPSEVEDATPTIRITVEMKEAAPYEAKLEGREVVLTFKK